MQPLLRLLEIEEYTRCQAFQACVMGEERSHVYQAAVRSIIEKLLGKLETHYPSFYQAAAGCLSDYMSALNHHCEICVVPPPPSALAFPEFCEALVRVAEVAWREVALMTRPRRVAALLGVLTKQATEEQALEELLVEVTPPKYTPDPDTDMLPEETEAESESELEAESELECEFECDLEAEW